MNKSIIARGIEIVVFVFSAFSGFFLGIAPPEESGSNFAIGLSSLIVLIMLLIISVLSKSRRIKSNDKYWLLSSCLALMIAVWSSLNYYEFYRLHTFSWPVERDKEMVLIAGTYYTPKAELAAKRFNNPSPRQMLEKFTYAKKNDVWSAESLLEASMILIRYYLLMTLSFCVAIFCLTEGLLRRMQRKATSD